MMLLITAAVSYVHASVQRPRYLTRNRRLPIKEEKERTRKLCPKNRTSMHGPSTEGHEVTTYDRSRLDTNNVLEEYVSVMVCWQSIKDLGI